MATLCLGAQCGAQLWGITRTTRESLALKTPQKQDTPGVKELIRPLIGEPGHTCMSCPVIPRPALGASGSVSGVCSQRRIKIKINQFNGHDSRCGILPIVGLTQEIEECLLPCLLVAA